MSNRGLLRDCEIFANLGLQLYLGGLEDEVGVGAAGAVVPQLRGQGAEVPAPLHHPGCLHAVAGGTLDIVIISG